MEDNLFPVDESLERALREERGVGGKFDLMTDMVRGHHARAVIAEMEHANQIKRMGEHSWVDGDFEFRPEAVLHGNGFHSLAMLNGGYDALNDEEFLRDLFRKHPEAKVRTRPRRTTIVVGSKYGPAKL